MAGRILGWSQGSCSQGLTVFYSAKRDPREGWEGISQMWLEFHSCPLEDREIPSRPVPTTGILTISPRVRKSMGEVLHWGLRGQVVDTWPWPLEAEQCPWDQLENRTQACGSRNLNEPGSSFLHPQPQVRTQEAWMPRWLRPHETGSREHHHAVPGLRPTELGRDTWVLL